LYAITETIPKASFSDDEKLELFEAIIRQGEEKIQVGVLRAVARSNLGILSLPLLDTVWNVRGEASAWVASEILNAVETLGLKEQALPHYRNIAAHRWEAHAADSVQFSSTVRAVNNLARILKDVEGIESEEAGKIAEHCRKNLAAMGAPTLFEVMAIGSFPIFSAVRLMPLALTLFERDTGQATQSLGVVHKLERALARPWPEEMASRGREVYERAKKDSDLNVEWKAWFARLQPKLHADAIKPAVEGLLRLAASMEAGFARQMRILDEGARRIADVNPMEAGRWLPDVGRRAIPDAAQRDAFLAKVALGLPVNFTTLWKQLETILSLAEAIGGAALRNEVLELASRWLEDWKARPKNTASPMTRDFLKRAEILDERISKTRREGL